MLSRHRVSRAAIELIKRFEGYRRTAAQLPDGRWTIGYGHTLTAREGAEVSEPDAEALLVYDLIAVQHAVNEGLLAPVTQNQFDALSSFAFNVGIDNFRRSQVLKRLNAGAPVQAACAMELWRKAYFEGERIVVDALVRRRSVEKALFLTPPNDAWTPAPSPLLRPVIDLDALDLVPLRRPVEVEASFEGPKVTARRDDLPDEDAPPEPTPDLAAPALTAAAEQIASRLEAIFPDTGEEPALLDLDDAPRAGETHAVRPQADFAPPITERVEGPEPEPPVVDAELAIPLAPSAPEPDATPEAPAEPEPYEFIPARLRPEPRPREQSVAWDLLLSLLGLAFFGFGVFWGLSARPAPTGAVITPFMVAWSAGLAGVGFVAVAVYRLLQRMGREAERD
ncbi:lysozyme [Phenylobacterium sp.]|uniref:lysozyme n=1 Tax=Phenylobacterium sp. TaxID=1871053 RepID=UPI0025D7C77E|nr:glycoside hydrolase family protein [Phenylobacterium sp.]MBX3483036.1 glycoside hydrolase family protein [Phenylobacterium sp.]MCW5760204.1 glycoside hydrolase family protein [Phenylobacterium sp.]